MINSVRVSNINQLPAKNQTLSFQARRKDDLERDANEVRYEIQELAGTTNNPKLVAIAGVGAGVLGAVAGYAAFKKSAPIVISKTKGLFKKIGNFGLFKKIAGYTSEIKSILNVKFQTYKSNLKAESKLAKTFLKIDDIVAKIKKLADDKKITKENILKVIIEAGSISAAIPAGMTAGNETMVGLGGGVRYEN